MPLVSVIIPAFNAAAFIDQTLASVYAQTFTDYEIIVVDDGSTDGTPQALLRHKDKITYIRQPNSGAPAGPRNLAVKISEAKYIAIFDADDLMEPQKLAVAVRTLEENPTASLFFSNFVFLRGNVREKATFFDQKSVRQILESVPKKPVGEGVFMLEKPMAFEILRNNFIGTSTVVIRRQDLLEIGLFDEGLVGIEDRDLWFRLAKAGKLFAYSSEVLSTYRYLQSGISRQTKATLSHIEYYERLCKEETQAASLMIIQARLARLYFGYGYAVKKQGHKSQARAYYQKAFMRGNLSMKLKSLTAMAKSFF